MKNHTILTSSQLQMAKIFAKICQHALEEQMEKMTAFCGLDCEKCDARIATVNDDDALRTKTAAFWSKLNGIEISKDMINCDGCRVDGIKTYFCENLCQIRQCALKNRFETCGACAQMEECEKLKPIFNSNLDAKNNLRKA